MSNVGRGTLQSPTIADKAEEAKRMNYESLTRNYIFQSVAVEHLGRLGTDTNDFLKQLCRKIIAKTDDKRAGVFLRLRLSLAIQIGNVAIVRELIERAKETTFPDL